MMDKYEQIQFDNMMDKFIIAREGKEGKGRVEEI